MRCDGFQVPLGGLLNRKRCLTCDTLTEHYGSHEKGVRYVPNNNTYYVGAERDDGWTSEAQRLALIDDREKRLLKDFVKRMAQPNDVLTKSIKETVVASPPHYRFGGNLQTIDLIHEVISKIQDGFLAYCMGNALKYLTRYGRKDGLQDIKKAIRYLEWFVEHVEKGQITHE